MAATSGFRWLIYDNEGSYNGWFDWIPRKYRVGYWSPIAVVFIGGLEASVIVYWPTELPAAPPATELFSTSHALDAAVFAWTLFVVVWIARTGFLKGLFISFTGWSWFLLVTRAAIATFRPFTGPGSVLANFLGCAQSLVRFPTVLGATVTFFVWNLLLLPLIYFFAFGNDAKKRAGFLRFNWSLSMTNLHVCNLPLAMIHTVVGSNVQPFTNVDLWAAFFVAAVYCLLYFLILDRAGVHLYPVFSPRAHWCVISYAMLIGLYGATWRLWNAFIAR